MKRNTKENILLQEFLQDEDFIVKCQCAISLLDTKLQIIDADLRMRYHRRVIHSRTNRIKSYESIVAKLKNKGLPEDVFTVQEKINDLIGVRAVCTYIDDLYEIVEMLYGQVWIISFVIYCYCASITFISSIKSCKVTHFI